MSISSAVNYDVAQSIINTMFFSAVKRFNASSDDTERLRIKEEIDMYKWEMNSLNGTDVNAYNSVINKALNFYSLIIKGEGDKK